MIVYFGTVIRKAPVEKGGEIVKLDWKDKRVIARHDVVPGAPDVTKGPNKRGQARGCRGIDFVGDMVTGANYHSIECFTPDLKKIKTVTNDMMVGLHETHHIGDGKVWVTSTAIDATFLVDLETSEVLDEYWPREIKEFQEQLDLYPLSIDKSVDNRDKFLDLHVAKDKSHVHLNGIQQHREEVYALFNRQGVVVNLTTKKVVLEHKKIKGAHNVIFLDDRTVAICGTRIGSVLIFDLEENKLKKEYVLRDYDPVKKHLFWPTLKYKVKLFLREKKITKSVIAAKPCFVRGLVKFNDLLFVGTSPAMILCFDLKTDELVDHYIYSKKTRAAIHGLNVREE